MRDTMTHSAPQPRAWILSALHSLGKSRLGAGFWLSAAWVLFMLTVAVTAPLLPWQDPIRQDYTALAEGSSWAHLLGTDHLGRDLLSRAVHGARVSFGIALTAPFIGMCFGLALGLCAGYFKGRVDTVVSVLVDTILAFPNIVLAIAVLFFMGATFVNLVVVISFYTIPQFTRIARANTLLFANREFVIAARAMGASNLRILVRELLPNVLVPLAAYSLLVMSYTIVLEGTLSFLGVGLPPPDPTWGRMIAEGIDELSEHPRIAFIPAGFMFLTILSINMMGDRLRKLTDVKPGNG